MAGKLWLNNVLKSGEIKCKTVTLDGLLLSYSDSCGIGTWKRQCGLSKECLTWCFGVKAGCEVASDYVWRKKGDAQMGKSPTLEGWRGSG
jgi:hypothetical protein